MYYYTVCQSPLGELTLASDGENLTGLWLAGQKYFMHSLPEVPVQKDDLDIFDRTKSWLDRYFAQKKPVPQELPLAPAGSEFRQRVWRILCDIPYGNLTTYAQIARQIAAEYGRSSMSAQAVGGAVAHNPISIIIPCHRVVGTDGSLTGYAGGIDKKIRLLELEGIRETMTKVFS